MHPIRTFFSELYAAVFATAVQKKIENTILLLAGIGFIIHLSFIFLFVHLSPCLVTLTLSFLLQQIPG